KVFSLEVALREEFGRCCWRISVWKALWVFLPTCSSHTRQSPQHYWCSEGPNLPLRFGLSGQAPSVRLEHPQARLEHAHPLKLQPSTAPGSPLATHGLYRFRLSLRASGILVPSVRAQTSLSRFFRRSRRLIHPC